MATGSPGWVYRHRIRKGYSTPLYRWSGSGAQISVPGVADGAGGGTRYAGLQAIIQAAGGEAANITVAAPSSETSWRVAARDHTHQYASRLAATGGIVSVPSDGVDFLHDTGMTQVAIRNELIVNKAYVESLTGVPCRVHVYPDHQHTRATMRDLRDAGYIAARDGWVSPYFPEGATMGDVYTTVAMAQTWALWQRYALLGHLQFAANPRAVQSGIGGLNKAQVEAYLYFTTANQSAPLATTLYGYDDLMAMWKDNNTWVSFNIHYNLTALEVQSLIEIFVADGDFWVDTLGNIAAYADVHHAPFGPVRNDEFVYEPLTGHAASDFGGAPWNGKKCAITFTCDDAQDDFIDNYLAAVQAAGGNVTVGVVKDWIGDAGYMTTAEVATAQATGVVEFGSHSVTHDQEVDLPGCTLAYSGTSALGAEVLVSGNNRLIQLYTGATGNWYDPLTGMAGFGGLFDADVLPLGDFTGDTWAPISGAFSGTGVKAGTGEIKVVAGPNGHLCVQAVSPLDASANYGGVTFTDAQLWSNVNGFTLFIIAESTTTASDHVVIGKMANANNREWVVFVNNADLSANGAAWASTAASGFNVDSNWHAEIVTWIPGAAQRVYRDSVTSAYSTGSAAVASLVDGNQTIKLFNRETGGGSTNGMCAAWGWLPRGIAHGGGDLATIMTALKTYGGL